MKKTPRSHNASSTPPPETDESELESPQDLAYLPIKPRRERNMQEAKQAFKEQKKRATQRATTQQENRVGKKHVGAYLPEDVAEALKAKAKDEGTTVQELFEQFAYNYLGDKISRERREDMLKTVIAKFSAKLGLTS